MDQSKRQLLTSGILGLGAAYLGLAGCSRRGGGALQPLPEPMGALKPTRDLNTGLPLLLLPEGFRYRTFSWAGTTMSDGFKVPTSADGMGVVKQQGSNVTLVRNHELRGSSGPIGPAELSYDVTGGGTTTLVFDTEQEKLTESWVSLSGTLANCAGGVTPWGTWLSCEEGPWSPTSRHLGPTLRQSLWKLDRADKEHGYVFEVPPEGVAVPRPVPDMGQFYHEAVAFDPNTGIAYLTEDSSPAAGFYRFLSRTEGHLADGGVLQMMRVDNGMDMRGFVPLDRRWPVSWVEIDQPDSGINPNTGEGDAVVTRGYRAGGSLFLALEGIVVENSRVYFTSKLSGAAGAGCLFEYDPVTETIRLLFDSPGHDSMSGPDNIAISPRGSLIICEDRTNMHTDAQSLFGLSRGGELFRFCQINPNLTGEYAGAILNKTVLHSEWAGVSFSKDGNWLFCNIYSPGVTIAMTGPWQDGLL